MKSPQAELEELIPGLQAGMPMDTALKLILAEIKRLKEFELKYKGLEK